jgi:GTP cyclohydrolase I
MSRVARGRGGEGRRHFDRLKVERAVRLLIEGLGAPLPSKELAETPRRVCDLYQEILCGMWEDPGEFIKPIAADRDHDLVIVKDIRFESLCEHHMLPFFGRVGVAYVPEGRRIVGISKIVRAVDAIAHRLQIQERMTSEIADVIDQRLKPAGVLVRIEAEHLCMTVRGVKKPGAQIVTVEARGILEQPERQALVLPSISR